MKVEELMIRHVAMIEPGDGLDVAAHRMQENECGCLPVVDEHGRPIAMLTDRDICMAAARSDAPLSALEVRAGMSRKIHTCPVGTSVAEAAGAMALYQVRRLPVVDSQGRLQGLVTLDDIARRARQDEDLLAPHVSEESVGRTLGDINRTRILCNE
jgi:CBS domain-containing protein